MVGFYGTDTGVQKNVRLKKVNSAHKRTFFLGHLEIYRKPDFPIGKKFNKFIKSKGSLKGAGLFKLPQKSFSVTCLID